MYRLPHLLDAIAAFYAALSILITYCACKPSCRICLHRDACPMRRRGVPQLLLKPICIMADSQQKVSRPALALPALYDAELPRIQPVLRPRLFRLLEHKEARGSTQLSETALILVNSRIPHGPSSLP